jgi:hypothetical protein
MGKGEQLFYLWLIAAANIFQENKAAFKLIVCMLVCFGSFWAGEGRSMSAEYVVHR